MSTTGLFKPLCVRGHLRTKGSISSNGTCKECKREESASLRGQERRQLRWDTEKNDQTKRAYMKKYSREYNFKKYGLTPEEYEALLVKQNYSCAICKIHQQDLKRALAIDHDHKTNKVRGLLCTICNTRVVFVVEEYSHVIDAAKSYLGGL